MDSRIPIVVATVLALCLAHAVCQANPLVKNAKINCNNFLEKIDLCGLAASYSFQYEAYGYPINEQTLKSSCAVSNDGFNCLKQYAKCFDPVVKQGLLSFVRGRKTRVNNLCKDPNSKYTKDTLTAFKCMHDNKISQFSPGENSLVKRLDAISGPSDLTFDQRLHLACCTIFDYKKRFLDDLAPQCTQYRDQIDEEVKSLIGEIMPLMCSKYQDNVRACSNLPKLTFPKKPRAKSMTRTILEIVVLMNANDSL